VAGNKYKHRDGQRERERMKRKMGTILYLFKIDGDW
jgi:hypothetical protein